MNQEDNILEIDITSGFFSTCTIILRNIIGYHNGRKVLPKLNITRLWNMYRDVNEDISFRFFSTREDNLYIEPSYFSTSSDEDQFSNFSLINFDYVNFLISKYFVPSQEVIDIKTTIIQKYDLDTNNLIAICYRGNDKKKETNIPTYDDMLSKLKEIKLMFPNKKVLVQSDEIEFCEFIQSHYSDAIIISETPKIPKSDSAVQYQIPYGQRVISAQNFLATTLIISECSTVILNSGNVGMWICLFRGNANNIYQYLNPLNNPTQNGWIN